jgi:hypothetical protein
MPIPSGGFEFERRGLTSSKTHGRGGYSCGPWDLSGSRSSWMQNTVLRCTCERSACRRMFEIRPWKSLVARVRLFWGSLSDRGYKRGSFIGLARGRPGGVVMSHDRQNLRPPAMQGSSNSEFHPSDLSFTKRMKHSDNSGFRRRGW